MQNIGVILSGGSGTRFGGTVPKQYRLLCGKEIISYSIDAFKKAEQPGMILVVAFGTQEEREKLEHKYQVKCISAGESRNDSIVKAMQYIKKHCPQCENILIHEAARPFIQPELIDDYFQSLDEYDAVITAQHITDSLGKYDAHVVDRSEYYLIQAPEAFRFPLLERYFSADSPITATVQQLPEEIRVKRNYDFKTNFKITYHEDLLVAEQLMKFYCGALHDEQ